MQLTKKLFLIFFALAALLVLSPGLTAVPVKATSLWDNQEGMTSGTATGKIGGAFGTAAEPQDIRVTVGKAINVFLSLLGIIFVVLIIYAGFLWMTANGEEEKVNKAKSILQQAIIGLVIIVAAYALTQFILTQLIQTVKTS